VMTVAVWTEQQPAGWSPAVTVYDVFGNPVAAQVLTNENGTIAIQIANAAANANYYVAVNAATSVPAASYGEYFLGIDFGSQATPLQTFAANTLSAGLADVATLQLSQSTLFHFVLTASAQNSITGGAVQLTITDQFGNNVATVTAASGSSQSITLLLAPGQYNFAISAVGPASGLSYTLLGLTESDGIGPQAVDTTTSTLPSGSGTSTSSGYIWYNGTYTFLGVL
jgi:hypothetical protein